MATSNTQAPDIFTEIETALQATQSILPLVLAAVGAAVPGAAPGVAAIANFLPLFQVALQGVQVVHQATGGSPAAATAAVIAHLTPGQPNAPALGPQAQPAS